MAETQDEKLDKNIRENTLARVGVTKPYTVFVLMMVVIILGWFSFTKFKLELMPNMNLPYVMVTSLVDVNDVDAMMALYAKIGVSPLDPTAMEQALEYTQQYAIKLEAEIQKVPGLTIKTMISYVTPIGVVSAYELEYGQDAKLASIRMQQAAERSRYAEFGFPKPDAQELGLDMAPVFAFTTTCTDETILKDLETALTSASGVAEVTARLRTGTGDVDLSKGFTRIGKGAAATDYKYASFFQIQKASSAITTETCDNIHAVLDKFKTEKGVETIVTLDQGGMIKTSIDDVMSNLLLGGLLSIIILFLFMRSWKITLVVALAIPMSVVGAFIFMYFMGIGLNIVSMSGLALVVGMLVDNSVIVLENIFRLRQKGLPIKDAAIKGASQILNAVIAATLTTVAVFFPMFFVSGLIMDVFMDLVWVVILALLASLVVAVGFVPAIVSSFRVGEKPKHEIKWIARVNNGINLALKGPTNAVKTAYAKSLETCIKYRFATVAVVIALFVGSLILGISKGFELMPATDEGEFSVSVGITRNDSRPQLDTILDTEASVLATQIGAALTTELGADLKTISIRYSGSNPQIEGRRDILSSGGTSLSFNVTLRDGHKIATKVASQNALNLITALVTENNSAYFLPQDISSSGGSGMNMMAEDSVTVTIAAPAGNELGEGLNELMAEIKTEIEKEFKNSSGELTDIFKITSAERAGVIYREDGRITQSLQIEINDGVTISKVQSRVDAVVERVLKAEKYAGFTAVKDGFGAQMEETLGQMMLALCIGILLVYLVMVAMFQSFRLPFVVLITVPLAFTGGFVLLAMCGMPISIVALIGFVVLTGVIVNNGIVLIDYVNKAREDGLTIREAVQTSAKVRARPILITMLTTVIALLPSAMGLGSNGALMQPLAIVSIGGLIYATAMSLLVVPCFYTLMFFKKDRLERKKGEIKNETK